MNRKISFIIGLVFLIIPATIFFVSVNTFSINIPYYDEYVAALVWIKTYLASSVKEQFLLMFKQANEHRILAYYSTVLIDYILNGSVNFRQILIFGNLGMILLLYILYIQFPLKKNRLLFFAPVTLMLLVPQHELTNWGIVSIGGTWFYVIIFSAFLLLHKNHKFSFSGGILLAILATFSFGGGLYTFLGGFIVLYLEPQKKFKHYLIWGAFMVGSLILFFTGYNYTAGPGSKTAFLQLPLETIHYVLVFFGTIFSTFFKGNIVFYTISGLITLLFSAFLIVFHWKSIKEYPVGIAFLFFILTSAGTAALSRVAFGIGAATAPRYLLLQAIFLSLLYIISIQIFYNQRKLIFGICLIAGMLLYTGRLKDSSVALAQHHSMLTEHLLSYHNQLEQIGTEFPPSSLAIEIINDAVEGGYYIPPTIQRLYPENQKKDLQIEIVDAENLLFIIDKSVALKNSVQIKGWVFLKDDNKRNHQILIGFKNTLENLVFSTKKMSRPDVVEYYHNSGYDLTKFCGFNLVVEKKGFSYPQEKYEIAIGIMENGTIKAMDFSSIHLDLNSLTE